MYNNRSTEYMLSKQVNRPTRTRRIRTRFPAVQRLLVKRTCFRTAARRSS
ncbi:hypothetical protein Hanom_Chr01g00092471 [Helianthus anomalus]